MSQVIVNLTLPIVVAKIETVLRDPTSLSPGTDLDMTDLRQRLTAYVLRRLPVIYVTLDQDAIRQMGTPSQCYSREQHRHIDHLIQQGLQAVIHAEPISGETYPDREAIATACANHCLTQEAARVSNWFG
ncbi:MAG: hypothetical protein VKI82_01780 [Leptolyngbya sp.]|nr:hypothetical protein [Leptolyngbya sp.]